MDSPEIQSRAARRKAFAVHVLTASGAITGLLALQSVIDGNIRAALLWLIACQILDGIDGPIARKYDTVTHAPHIDGHILDLVVDYVTCVVVPVAFLVRLHLLPDHWQMILAALIIFTSALWFARSDLETDDAWFNGFPAAWNVVVPTYLILDSGKIWACVITVVLCAAQLTRLKFPHLMRVRAMRKTTISISVIYLIALTVLSAEYPRGSLWAKYVLLLGPLYLLFLVIWRTFFPSKSIFGQRITT